MSRADVVGLPLFAPADARAEGLARSAEHELHRALILGAFRDHGPATADAAGERAGLMPLQARPRVTELTKAGQIRPTGRRGVSAFGNSAAILEVAR